MGGTLGGTGQSRPDVRTLVVSDLHLGCRRRGGPAAARRSCARRWSRRSTPGRPARRSSATGWSCARRRTARRPTHMAPLLAEAGRGARAGRRDRHARAATTTTGWSRAGSTRRLQTEPSGFLGLSEPVAPADGRAARRRGWPTLAGPARCRSPTPASGCATTSTPSTATTSTCTRRCRRSSASPPARWRAGSSQLPEPGARPDDYEAALAPLYAVPAPAHPALRPRGGQRRRGRVGARVGRARGGRAARSTRSAPPLLGTGYVGRGRGAQRARPRAGRPRPLRRRAAPRRPARRCARCCAGSASRPATSCSATRTAPARGRATIPRSGARRRGTRLINTGSWVYQPHFLSAEPERLALLARHGGRRRRRRARRGSSACWASAGTRELRPPA